MVVAAARRVILVYVFRASWLLKKDRSAMMKEEIEDLVLFVASRLATGRHASDSRTYKPKYDHRYPCQRNIDHHGGPVVLDIERSGPGLKVLKKL